MHPHTIGEKVLSQNTIVYRSAGNDYLQIHCVQFRGNIELDAYLQQGRQRWRIHNAAVKTVEQASSLLKEWMDEASALGFVCATKFRAKKE